MLMDHQNMSLLHRYTFYLLLSSMLGLNHQNINNQKKHMPLDNISFIFHRFFFFKYIRSQHAQIISTFSKGMFFFLNINKNNEKLITLFDFYKLKQINFDNLFIFFFWKLNFLINFVNFFNDFCWSTTSGWCSIFLLF